MLARVKQDYTSGAVIAFSGREYVTYEWRDVPAGFEEQAKKHELLDTQPALDDIRAHGPTAPGLVKSESATVTVETAEPHVKMRPAEPEIQSAEVLPATSESAEAIAQEPQLEPNEEPPAETQSAEEDPTPKSSRRRRRSAED